VVRYWPGGSFASAPLRRPAKPREMIVIETPIQQLNMVWWGVVIRKFEPLTLMREP
jgi:hypothetical protein